MLTKLLLHLRYSKLGIRTLRRVKWPFHPVAITMNKIDRDECPPDVRYETMTPAECLEYSKRYRMAARDVRRKWGKRAAYRRDWLQAAWLYRSKG